MARIETVAIQANNVYGYKIVNKAEVPEGVKPLTKAQHEKLVQAYAAKKG